MNNKPWYELLFENYSKTYDKEIFTQGTLLEVDFYLFLNEKFAFTN